MKIDRAVAIVTGAGSGIGQATALRLAEAGAEVVVACDLREELAEETARMHARVVPKRTDVADRAQLRALIQDVNRSFGVVDILVSNAGVLHRTGIEEDDMTLQRMWDIHVMAHLRASRLVLPAMLARRRGHLVSVASAAGLLAQVDALGYTITKTAAVSLAEWLAITYGDQGVGVSVVCPQAVDTRMIKGSDDPGDVLPAAAVAHSITQGIEENTFLLTPHEEVRKYRQRKAADTDRWIRGMRRLRNEQLT